jgi:hypothetical protein
MIHKLIGNIALNIVSKRGKECPSNALIAVKKTYPIRPGSAIVAARL